MSPDFVIVGQLRREYLLPAFGPPRLDAPGGNALYAAGGLAVWDSHIGLVARVGEDYPQEWLERLKHLGWDLEGVRRQTGPLDQRFFLAWSEDLRPSRTGMVAHFTQRGLPFPKTLLGFQPQSDTQTARSEPDPVSPSPAYLPLVYLEAKAFHLCSLDVVTQQRFLERVRRAIRVVTLDPPAALMAPAFQQQVRGLVNGITAFVPSLEEMKALFWGETNDPWEMAAAVGEWGCEFVVIKCGERGQLVYDAVGKHRWEIAAYPARVADPTGVGDAFCGGFLAGYCKNYDVVEGVLYGNVSASLAIEGSGPFYPLEALPGLAQRRFESLREWAIKKR